MLRFALRSGLGVDHRSFRVHASFEKVCTRQELADSDSRFRAKVSGKRVVVLEHEGKLYCVSNVCTHLELPFIGRTAVAQAKVVEGCIECPFHKTKFKLDTGDVVGEWAPTFPSLPFIEKGKAAPLPTYEVRETEEGDIEVAVG